jgi:hypothetical protein
MKSRLPRSMTRSSYGKSTERWQEFPQELCIEKAFPDLLSIVLIPYARALYRKVGAPKMHCTAPRTCMPKHSRIHRPSAFPAIYIINPENWAVTLPAPSQSFSEKVRICIRNFTPILYDRTSLGGSTLVLVFLQNPIAIAKSFVPWAGFVA